MINDPVNTKNDPVNDPVNLKNDPNNLKNDPESSENDPNNLKNDPKNEILDLIRKDKYITAKKIANDLNKSEKTIKRYLKELKEDGYIERIGADKNGFWKVLKERND